MRAEFCSFSSASHFNLARIDEICRARVGLSWRKRKLVALLAANCQAGWPAAMRQDLDNGDESSCFELAAPASGHGMQFGVGSRACEKEKLMHKTIHRLKSSADE